VECKSCGKRLKLPEGKAITKVRCPGCSEVISVTKTGITAKPPAPLPKEIEKPRPGPDAEAITADAPKAKKARPRKDDERIREDRADDEPRPRKKRRRRRREEKPASEIPLWVWGALAGVVLLFAGIISAVFIHSGHGLQLLAFAIGMAIILPVSVVILVISMFLASAMLGGVDFGQAHVAIPKAGALLFAVNVLLMIPLVGWLLALPVWWLGLMGLFGLDFVETRTLVAINWSLNALFKYFVLAAILSGIVHSSPSDRPRTIRPLSGEAAAVKQIEALKGSCEPDEEEGNHITEVELEGTAADDSSLAVLRSFPRLRALNLARTRVTDQGLPQVAALSALEHLDLSGNPQLTDQGIAQLAGLPRLQSLSLEGTRVTDAGIQKLRAARPGLRVAR
jgi:hypothetical protein